MTQRLCKAAVADGKGNYQIGQIAIGAPKDDEILIKLHAAGLCHTDWDTLTSRDYPFVLGHEGAGMVVEIGPDVLRFKVGDRVVLNWAIPCGSCKTCARGHFPLCEVTSPANGDGTSGHAHAEATLFNGSPIRRSFFLGTMSEYTVVRQSAASPLRADIPFSSACILGCGVMTGYGSVVNAARLKTGSNVAVIGCGGVGLNVIQACRIAGARCIFAVDISDARLEQARAFGATELILSDPDDTELTRVRTQIEAKIGEGADYAFECTAIPALAAAPLAVVRHGGTAVQVSGVEQRINFDCRLFEWDKTYLNPLYGMCNPAEDFEILQSHYLSGALKLDEQITKTYALDDLPEAFEDLFAGKLAKGVILFEETG